MANIAIKKTFFKDKMDCSIGMNDIFFTWVGQINSIYATNQTYHTVNTYDTRRATMSFSYNFGKVKVQERNKKQDEEKRRLGR